MNRFPVRPVALSAALLALVTSSCVSQQRHAEEQRTAQHYQRLYHDLQRYQDELEAENARLAAELGSVKVQEAGFDQEIDARLAELRSFVDSLGATTGDITPFQFEGGYGYRVADAVLFDTASAELRPEGREVLLKLAQEIGNAPYGKVWVRGHTDNVPIVKPATKQRYPFGNLQLSVDRAVTVAGLLMTDGGLAEEGLGVAGVGASEPVVPNTSADNRRQNRRVEILVLEDAAEGEGAGD